MPTYAYRCTACSHEFEVFQKFSDQPLTECPECGSPVRKVFQPVGIVFKGSGWYINDSRKPESDGTKTDDKATKPEKATGDTPAKAEPAKGEPAAKPAAAPATAKAAD